MIGWCFAVSFSLGTLGFFSILDNFCTAYLLKLDLLEDICCVSSLGSSRSIAVITPKDPNSTCWNSLLGYLQMPCDPSFFPAT